MVGSQNVVVVAIVAVALWWWYGPEHVVVTRREIWVRACRRHVVARRRLGARPRRICRIVASGVVAALVVSISRLRQVQHSHVTDTTPILAKISPSPRGLANVGLHFILLSATD